MYTTRAGSTRIGTPGNGTAQFVGRWEDISGGAYHALAPNDTTGRPQLSARVNLVTHSEDVSNALWAKTAFSVTGKVAGPDGTLIADRLLMTGGTAAVGQTITTPVATRYTYVFFAKYEGFAWLVCQLGGSGTERCRAWVNIQTITAGSVVNIAPATGTTISVSAAGNGYARIELTGIINGVGTTNTLLVFPADGDGSLVRPANSAFYIAQSDLRPTNIHAAGSIPAYQRVVDAETYDSVGFPYRFIPNGTGQAFQTSTITPGSDSVTVVSGIRTLRDANEIVIESSPSVDANQGAIQLARISSNIYRSVSVGSGTVVQANSGSVPFPLTTVLTHTSDISQPSVRLSRNPGDAVENTGSQGSGNYLAYPINIFSRNSALFWFGGQGFRQFICFGPALSAGETATVESWVNESAKAY
jgi:hypothetical protein